MVEKARKKRSTHNWKPHAKGEEFPGCHVRIADEPIFAEGTNLKKPRLHQTSYIIECTECGNRTVTEHGALRERIRYNRKSCLVCKEIRYDTEMNSPEGLKAVRQRAARRKDSMVSNKPLDVAFFDLVLDWPKPPSATGGPWWDRAHLEK